MMDDVSWWYSMVKLTIFDDSHPLLESWTFWLWTGSFSLIYLAYLGFTFMLPRRVIEKNYHLHRSSRDAYRSYMHAYAAHSHKDCFDVHKLDLSKVAKAFGFAHPPKVELNLKHTARKKATGTKGTLKKQLSGQSSGHQFSADNPYGQRDANDKRQFSRWVSS